MLTIPGRFPNLNDYVRASHNEHARRRMKAEADGAVAWAVLTNDVPRLKPPVRVTVDCYEKDARRDPDNVHSMARKFVLDGLVAAGVIKDDSRKYVEQCPDRVLTDRARPRVVVEVSDE